MAEDDREEFRKAIAKIPVPISCFSDGAVCPWCGCHHRTVTFGMNRCEGCQRSFGFGCPDWHEGKDPISYVNFPHMEFHALGGKAKYLDEWKPNDRLKEIYFQKSEETLGVRARDSGVQ